MRYSFLAAISYLILLGLAFEMAQASDSRMGLECEGWLLEMRGPRLSPATPLPSETFTVKGASFTMVRLPRGELVMGDMVECFENGCHRRPHPVRISSDFWIGQTEVTQRLWKAVTGKNPACFWYLGGNHPVERVSWNDCQEFIRMLNALISGGGFRLPSEAEWEYACRAGTVATAEYQGDDRKELREFAWFSDNCSLGTHAVALKRPNAWGLYDMQGNVWEWCQNWYGEHPSSPVADPAGPPSFGDKVVKGGACGFGPLKCSPAVRGRSGPEKRHKDLGFRLARDLGRVSGPAVPGSD